MSNRFVSWLKHELVEAAPAAAWFFVSFQVIALTDALILEDYGVRVSTFMLATVAALVAAKVVLILDMLPVANRYAHRPLLVSVAWKTLLSMIGVVLFRYAEHLLPQLLQHRDLAEAHRHMLQEIQWPRVASAQIWMLVLFSLFFLLRELGRVLGRERLKELLIRSPA
jgi:uncharacterized membrane protein